MNNRSIDYSLNSAIKSENYVVSPRAREKIVVGECVVSADFLQMEVEHGAQADHPASPHVLNKQGHWLEGKLMHESQVEDLSVQGYGTVLPSRDKHEKGALFTRRSISDNHPSHVLNTPRSHAQQEICAVFDVIDIDRDDLISYDELNENLRCHPSIASMLGIRNEYELQSKIDLLFRTDSGQLERIDKATFTSFFLFSYEELNQEHRKRSDAFEHIPSDYDIVPELFESGRNSRTMRNFGLSSQALENGARWLNESALETWTASDACNVTKIRSGANTLVHTPVSSNSEQLHEIESPVFKEFPDLLPSATPRRASKQNCDFDGRYHTSSETLLESLSDENNILLETFLLIPSDTSQDMINQALSWPLAKNSFLMEF